MFLSHLSKQFFEFVCFAQLLFTRSTFSNLKKLHFINSWFCTWFGGTGFIKKPPNDRLLLQTLISLIFCLHLNRGNTLIRRLREVRSKWLRFCNELFFFLQVNLFQKHLFLHQLTHNMTKVVHLIMSSVHENSKLRTCWEHVVYINCSECQNKTKKQIQWTIFGILWVS